MGIRNFPASRGGLWGYFGRVSERRFASATLRLSSARSESVTGTSPAAASA